MFLRKNALSRSAAALILLFAFAGCGGGDGNSGSNSNANPTPNPQPNPQPTPNPIPNPTPTFAERIVGTWLTRAVSRNSEPPVACPTTMKDGTFSNSCNSYSTVTYTADGRSWDDGAAPIYVWRIVGNTLYYRLATGTFEARLTISFPNDNALIWRDDLLVTTTPLIYYSYFDRISRSANRSAQQRGGKGVLAAILEEQSTHAKK